ncbi:MAG: zinc-dependent alcohol dehydrogenase family protein [Planctomycetes bacterium]|nr:zinc-dependent alcohol dehydrogenase family protein [Planctomycetota bacterium]
MKAAVYEAFRGPIRIQTVPDPAPDECGAVIRVRANGICRSDWHGWMGHDPDIRVPHVPGHELAGEVEAVGSRVTRWRRGDRVTVPFVCACGACPQCASGNHQVCDRQEQPGFTHWGSFAEFVALHYADVNLVRLPDEVDFVTAASLGCRFATSFRAIVAQGRVLPGQWVAVHGCGGVGLSAIMIAAALGANVVGVDIQEDKLRFAEWLGAARTVNASEVSDVAQAVRDLTGGGAHVSVDALGSPATCANSVLCLRKRGRHVQVGLLLAEQSAPPVPMDRVIARELEILGSHGMQAHRYGEMLAMVAAGKLRPDRLIGKTVSLEEAVEELTAMDRFRGTGVTVINRF